MLYYVRAITLVIVMSYLCLEGEARELGVPPAGLWRQTAGANACEANCQQQLVQHLTRLTGWQGWTFNESGRLVAGDTERFEGGSAIARQWFQRVWQKQHVFFIEDHSGSPSVNFGQLDEGLKYSDDVTGRHCLVWRVRLDFEDFRKYEASRAVREAFTPGFTLLHELLHGLGYRDSHTFEEVGECEAVVNETRRELGLVERARYFAEALIPMRYVTTARLLFQRTTNKGKKRNEWLYFSPGRETLSEVSGEITAAVKARRR